MQSVQKRQSAETQVRLVAARAGGGAGNEGVTAKGCGVSFFLTSTNRLISDSTCLYQRITRRSRDL